MSKDWADNLTKGLPVPPGGEIPLRQDLRDLSKEQLYLYLEGLKRFQDVPKDYPLSYFKIAGIHGLPYESWPDPLNTTDIPAKPREKGDTFYGFCTHTSIIFLTWHRPYLALFEATLHGHVKEIASGIDPSHPGKKIYTDLAEKFRIPYWDWARKDTQIVPQETLEPEYPADGPPSSKSIPKNYNPLYAYPFPKGTTEDITVGAPTPILFMATTTHLRLYVIESASHFDSVKFGKNGYETTVRYAGVHVPEKNILTELERFYKLPSTEEQFPVLTPEHNLRERTAWILQAYNSYVAMSKNEFRKGKDGNEIDDAANWGSLEDIHNAIHYLVGGNGHMSSVPRSAFDPIFWLHHTNIDRLFGIWQALHEDDDNPNAFILPRPNGMGSFATKIFDEETIDTPLYPFRPDVNSWYTSKMVKRTEPFGYTYPETAGLKYPTTPADKTALMKIIGKLYAPLPKLIRESKEHKRNAGEHLLPQAQVLKEISEKKVPATVAQLESLVEHLPDIETLLETSLQPGKPVLRDLAPENKYLEWITNIKAEKHTLDGGYSVHIFLGNPDESNVALWPASPSHVGTFAPLGQLSTTGCGKCQEDQRDHTEVTSQIPLTIALVERYLAGLILDLSEESVVPYLTKNLHWRVSKSDGTVLEDQSRVRGLLVFVVSNEVTIPEDDAQLPIYAPDVKIYPDITTNREGTGRGNGTGLTPNLVPS